MEAKTLTDKQEIILETIAKMYEECNNEYASTYKMMLRRILEAFNLLKEDE